MSDDTRRTIQERASPEGIVAILFTDDVGSTRLRQRLGDQAAQERMRRHNQAVREQIAKHSGFEVKTWGDAFMIVFSDVAAALACAVDIQQAVAQDNERHPKERIEVRIGLNAGQAIKEEEDFFGGSVVVAARLQALAKGGQILVSEAVRVLAGLPQGIGYVRQGRRQLKGLEGRYDIWRVPWREEQPSVLARLWARPAVRVIAPVLLLLVVGGGVAGGVTLNRGGGGSGSDTFREVTYRYFLEGAAAPNIISGDCESGDLVVYSDGPDEGDVRGDVTGRISVTENEATFYARCDSGFLTNRATLTDASGNSYYQMAASGPFSATFSPDLEGLALVGSLVVTVTGGTGVYDGATGTGRCEWTSAGPVGEGGPTGRFGADVECTLKMGAAGAAAEAAAPLAVEVVASPPEVAIFGGSANLPTTLAMVVVYVNNREEPQRGLALTLQEPEGARLQTAARATEEEPVSGERVWPLPELGPGEIARFEFTLQFLAAETPVAALVVEIDGAGFQEPVRTEPVTIEVVQ